MRFIDQTVGQRLKQRGTHEFLGLLQEPVASPQQLLAPAPSPLVSVLSLATSTPPGLSQPRRTPRLCVQTQMPKYNLTFNIIKI